MLDDIDPTASNPAPVTVQCIADVPASDITVVTDEAITVLHQLLRLSVM